MGTSAEFLLTIGGILLLGLVTSALARRTVLPRVTLLLVFGIIIGGEVLDIVPAIFAERFDIIADMTLLMVGFLLGGRLTANALRDCAGEVLWVSVCAALMTAVVVSTGLMLAGLSPDLSIILGCIASATAPAAIMDVVSEFGTETRFSGLLLSIVALDDVWALVLFAVGLSIASMLNGSPGDTSFLWMVSSDIGGAFILGLVVGLPATYLTGRIKRGQPMLIEALGIVFVCGGLAIYLGVSYLIASMSMGAVIANLARHHEYPFHAIEGIEWPFMVIFFVLAGASLELTALAGIGLVGAVYICCRSVGKFAGAGLGGIFGGSDSQTRKWMGVALLPQAGVAIGMALVASNQFPEHRQLLLSIVISATVVFELIGPVFTRLAIQRTQTE